MLFMSVSTETRPRASFHIRSAMRMTEQKFISDQKGFCVGHLQLVYSNIT